MRFGDVVSRTGPWPEGAERRTRPGQPDLVAPTAGRRGFLGGALAAATGVGLAALGVFPAARSALASPEGRYGYRLYRGACRPFATGHDCEPGCGASPVFLDTCEQDGPNRGWFKDRPTQGYRLRPGHCLDDVDAWLWRFQGTCGVCSRVIEYRCHDGYRRSGGGWFRANCRWTTECDGRPATTNPRHSPLGEVALFQRPAPDQVRLRGWAVDGDGGKVTVRFRRGGLVLSSAVANRYSNDIPPAYRAYGRRHGFDVRLRDLPPGTHVIRVHALSNGPGNTVEIFRRTITVP